MGAGRARLRCIRFGVAGGDTFCVARRSDLAERLAGNVFVPIDDRAIRFALGRQHDPGTAPFQPPARTSSPS